MKQIEAYRFLLNDSLYEVGKQAKSPIPTRYREKEDGTASFSTKQLNDGRIIWRDFGFKAKLGNDLVALAAYVGEYAELSREECEANFDLSKIEITRPSFNDIIDNIKIPVAFETTELDWRHYQYFERLYCGPEQLQKYRITGLDSVYRGRKEWFKQSRDNLAFFFKVGKTGEKAYMPFNVDYKGKKRKFYHQNIMVPEGYDQLPRRGKTLGFTKSTKDIVFLDNLGHTTISSSSESMFDMIDPFIPELLQRFDDFWFWGDDDPAGENYSYQLKQKFNCGRIIKSDIAKDPTDICIKLQQDHKRDSVIRIINKIIG